MDRVRGESKLPEAPRRLKCEECGHVSETYLTAPNPFESDETIIACENCKQVECLVAACWKCDRQAGIGTTASTEFRYVNTCYEHNPERATSL
jgi:hypothetical protein